MYAPAQAITENRRVLALGELSTIFYFAAIVFALTMLLFMQQIGHGNILKVKYVCLALAWTASAADLILDPDSYTRLTRALRAYWSLAVVAVIVTAGSLFTRIVYGIQDTFLPEGLGYSGFFIAMQLLSPARLPTFGRLLVKTFVFFSLLAFAQSPFYFLQKIPTLHEAGYLFVPWVLYFAWQRRRGVIGRALIALALLAIGPLCLKNTITITGALCLGLYYVFDHVRAHSLARTASFARTYAIAFAILAAVAAFYLLAPPIDGFSSGNAEFRKYCYTQKFHQFLESPLVGNFYVGPPYIPFTLFVVEIGDGEHIAVTHNDFLDMLASGGVLVFGLVLWALLKVARSLPAKFKAAKANGEEYGTMVALTGVVLGGVIAMSFNPVLGNLYNGFLFWTSLGITAAFCRARVFVNGQSPRSDGSERA